VLTELRVRDLGVIAELSLVLGPGMTAVTGETGAGKTLVVTAIELLVGGKADPGMVRPGASEAVVEGRFVVGDDEVVLRRVVPASGRSRGYVGGSMATLAELAERGAALVDLHGQHDHQSLLTPAVQRRALDRYGGVDLEPLRGARKELAAVQERLAELGGDERERAREMDLLRFQVEELEAAGLEDPGEDERLRQEAELLADATGHRDAAASAVEALVGDGGAADALSLALVALDGRSPFAEAAARLHAAAAELADVAADVRQLGESIDADPERQAAVGARRQLLQELRRKYGETLAEVLEWARDAQERLGQLDRRDAIAAELDDERDRLQRQVTEREQAVAAARSACAAPLGAAVQAQLPDLALPKARVEVQVDGVAGRDVVFQFAANPGMPLQPLARVASGGELARAMLALRLVLTEGPPVLVFDEVDAGIGGAAALAVGRSLATIAADHQVLVVTHLAQVAAWADAQVVVDKAVEGDTTSTTVVRVEGEERVTELARMLSGTPGSSTARDHARELLASAAEPRPAAGRGARPEVAAPTRRRGTGRSTGRRGG
jgi:DNA repair protein RecN (Recombination protein N)